LHPLVKPTGNRQSTNRQFLGSRRHPKLQDAGGKSADGVKDYSGFGVSSFSFICISHESPPQQQQPPSLECFIGAWECSFAPLCFAESPWQQHEVIAHDSAF
jgi:hypothetical protein